MDCHYIWLHIIDYSSMINIIGLGDIMPGGVLNGTTNKFVSKDVKSLLAKGDIRVGTLETAVGNNPTFYSEKMKNHIY